MNRLDVWVSAGPNGAGKSTLARRVLIGRVPVVNPDDLAAEIDLANRDMPVVQVAAGRKALAAREAHLEAKRSFAIETTLTGRSELELMRRARDRSFRVNLVFIGLDDVALSATRVAQRVREGGHNVPAADLQRRFTRSLAHLAPALMIADRAWVFDNSGEQRKLILARRRLQVRHLAERLPAWAEVAIPSQLRTRSEDGVKA